MKPLLRIASLAAALFAISAAADDEQLELHNHSRHARSDILYGSDRSDSRYQWRDETNRPHSRPKLPQRRFSNSDRAAYKLWCQQNEQCFGLRPPEDLSHLPPGLRGKVDRDKPLPAGWEKRLRPGARIDPQVYAYAQPATDEILQALPKQPRDTLVVTIDGRLVRLSKPSLIILDVFKLEF